MATTEPHHEDAPPDTDRLQYMTAGELRQEIAYAAGGDPSRYGPGAQKGLLKATVRRVAEQLQPAGSSLAVHELDLRDLYESVCAWAGGEYEPNAGNAWGINRANLKAIHRALDATDPHERPLATDGGTATTDTADGDHDFGTAALRDPSDVDVSAHARANLEQLYEAALDGDCDVLDARRYQEMVDRLEGDDGGER